MYIYHSEESISADKCYRVAQNGFSDRLIWTQSGSRRHRYFGVFDQDTGIQFDFIGMFVQLTQVSLHLSVRVNLLEGLVLHEPEEVTKFVQGRSIPGPGLFHPQHCHSTQRDGDARVKCGYG